MSKILHSFLLTAALLLALADARAQATNLFVSQVPVAPASNGSVFSTQPKVTLRDGANATVTTDSTTVVTMTVSRNATVVGTATATCASGVATFSGVGISGLTSATYTLTFTSSGASGGLSVNQNIVNSAAAGPASRVMLSTYPGVAVNGSSFVTQPVIAIRDDAGNLVTTGSYTITMTVDQSGSVVGTAAVTTSSGVATYSGLGLSGTADTTYTVTFSEAGSVLSPVSAAAKLFAASPAPSSDTKSYVNYKFTAKTRLLSANRGDAAISALQSGNFKYIFLAETDAHNLLAYRTDNGTLTTLVGAAGSGNVDGVGTLAKISYPKSVAVIDDSNLIVGADSGYLKKITFSGGVSASSATVSTLLNTYGNVDGSKTTSGSTAITGLGVKNSKYFV